MLLIQISFLGCPAVGDGGIVENIVEIYRCRNMRRASVAHSRLMEELFVCVGAGGS